jgi:hypothetical protein
MNKAATRQTQSEPNTHRHSHTRAYLARAWLPLIAAPIASTASAPTIRTTSRVRRAALAAAAATDEGKESGGNSIGVVGGE